MDEKYIIKVQENEDRSKSNLKRLDKLEKEVEENNVLAINVRELTIEIKHMREDYQKSDERHTEEMKKIDSRLAEVESKPAKKWEQIVSLVTTRYSHSYTGFFISKNRLIRK